MIDTHLRALGFEEKEAKVFSVLSELGKATAQEISKRAEIPRATIYGLLEILRTRGVVSPLAERGTTYFSLTDPSAFLRIVEDEKKTLEKKEVAAKQLIDILTPVLSGSTHQIPKVQIFDGKRSVEEMLFRYIHEWRKSYEKINCWTLWGYQDHTFVEQYRRWHEYAWAIRDDREEIKLFSNIEGVHQQKKEGITRREIRPLPAGLNFSSSIWVHGEYIVLGMTREKPHYAVVLVDSILSANLRAIFEMLWTARF